MENYDTERQYYSDQDDYLNVGALINDYFRTFKKTWFLFILLILIGIASVYGVNKIRKQSYYGATISYSLDGMSDIYTDSALASRLAKGIRTLTSSADFKNELIKEMGVDSINENYQISGVPTDSSNLFTVNVYCTNLAMTDQLAKAFQNIYPKWVNKYNRNITLTVTDEMESTGEILLGLSNNKIVMYGILVGVAIWGSIATIFLLAVRKVHGDGDMYQIVSAECLGILPVMRKKRRDRSTVEPLLISSGNVPSYYMQPLRSMRGYIEQHIREDKKIFMLTSTLHQEGKSLLTMNIAISLQHRNKKVLVIDADLRHSGIGHIMQISEETAGLAEYLRNGKLTEVNFQKIKGITLLSAGNDFVEISRRRSMNNMKKLLENIEEDYDVILIDSAPVSIYGDAVRLMDIVDEVFYVVRGDYAHIKDIRKGIEPFYKNEKLGGYILNGVEKTAPVTNIGYHNASYGHYRYGNYRYSQYRDYGRYKYYSGYGESEEEKE